MANLYSSRQRQTSDGFNPQINETPIQVKATSGQVAGWWICFALTILTVFGWIIMLVMMIKKKNRFVDLQTKIEEATSQIQVEQKKRYDTLMKVKALIESDQSFESTTQTQIARLRSGDISASQAEINNFHKTILGQIEAYPELRSHQSIMEGISTSQAIENEIAASRRWYNSNVRIFNSEINTWPGIVFASKMQLETFVQFAADEQSMQDVDMRTF